MPQRPRAEVEKAVRRMQDNTGPLPDEQIAALVDFLMQPDAKARIAALDNPPPVEIAPEQKAASVDAGRRLFYGDDTFANRGVPCAGCHTVAGRGGSLAADLTSAYERRGEAALLAAAQQPAFPLMKAAYATHPLTRQEAYHLVAFFQKPPQQHATTAVVHRVAGAITFVTLGGIALLARRNRRGKSSGGI
jgi:hypothetical protein